MRNLLTCLIGAGLFAVNLQAATVGFTVSPLGGSNFRYTYDFTALSLLANQEVDIRFSPTLFSTLTNGIAGANFSLAVFQPNNPPGASGDYAALALINNPPLSGPFRIDVTFLGTGTPGSQPFFINQYDAAGNFLRVVDSGSTTPPGGNVPEPATWLLGSAGLIFTGIASTLRRRRTHLRDRV
jgi:hypothetical protein